MVLADDTACHMVACVHGKQEKDAFIRILRSQLYYILCILYDTQFHTVTVAALDAVFNLCCIVGVFRSVIRSAKEIFCTFCLGSNSDDNILCGRKYNYITKHCLGGLSLICNTVVADESVLF